MRIKIAPRSHEIERPPYVWPAVVLEVLTGVLAIPVGWSFIQDPTGQALGIPDAVARTTPIWSTGLLAIAGLLHLRGLKRVPVSRDPASQVFLSG